MSNKAKVVVLKICCQAVGFLLATSVLQQGKQLDTLEGMLALGEGQRKTNWGSSRATEHTEGGLGMEEGARQRGTCGTGDELG